MRYFLIFVAIALTGCAAKAPSSSLFPAATPPAAPGPIAAWTNGTIWINDNLGTKADTSTIGVGPLAANASIHAKLHIGDRMAAQELPVASANASVRMLDDTNAIVAQVMLTVTEPDAIMNAGPLRAGPYKLVFETHGGSDGGSSGDYVSYAVEAAWGSA